MKIISKFNLALLVLSFMVIIPIAAYAADGQIKIAQTPSTTFPIVIDKPGSYVLTSNIVVSDPNAHGIDIRSNNVSINLNGFAIIGPGGGTGSGIFANNQNNISIINGTVRDFANGINLQMTVESASYNHQVKDMRVYSNSCYGIVAGVNSLVKDCTANNNNCTGIWARHSIITNSTANNNKTTGIDVSSASTVINCVANFNGVYGIFASSSTITNCTTHLNGSTTSGGRGIWAAWSVVTNCTANGNTDIGIAGNDRTTISNCAVIENGVGITCLNDCRIVGNNVRNNGLYGIMLSFSHNYVVNNVASDNSWGNYEGDLTNNYMPTTGDNANIGW
jgi:parallel beta-helix repeat protein